MLKDDTSTDLNTTAYKYREVDAGGSRTDPWAPIGGGGDREEGQRSSALLHRPQCHIW